MLVASMEPCTLSRTPPSSFRICATDCKRHRSEAPCFLQTERRKAKSELATCPPRQRTADAQTHMTTRAGSRRELLCRDWYLRRFASLEMASLGPPHLDDAFDPCLHAIPAPIQLSMSRRAFLSSPYLAWLTVARLVSHQEGAVSATSGGCELLQIAVDCWVLRVVMSSCNTATDRRSTKGGH